MRPALAIPPQVDSTRRSRKKPLSYAPSVLTRSSEPAISLSPGTGAESQAPHALFHGRRAGQFIAHALTTTSVVRALRSPEGKCGVRCHLPEVKERACAPRLRMVQIG